jgi:hypothetical protein
LPYPKQKRPRLDLQICIRKGGVATLIQIPIEFQFRRTQVKWVKPHARIIGWWKRSDGSVDGENLSAVDGENLSAEVTAGCTGSIRFPIEQLPEREWQQCIATLNDDGVLQRIPDSQVEKVCSAFEPLLLVRCDRTYDLRHVEPIKFSQSANAWHMRDDFLRLQPNLESALAFLNKWGSWDFGEFVSLTDLIRLQEAMREGLMHPDRWFASQYSVPPLWHRRPQLPFPTIVTDKCEIALCLTVTFDLIRKAKFKICARPDCAQPFELKSKHERRFCSRKCSHLELVRRSRGESGS